MYYLVEGPCTGNITLLEDNGEDDVSTWAIVFLLVKDTTYMMHPYRSRTSVESHAICKSANREELIQRASLLSLG